MTKRKGLSKKTRFEVFKRDSFTCQYCGGQAPDVVLRVDHINPVAGGGDNDILNLITSCEPCNQGKGARTLDDNSVILKQKAQLDELNKRREQLEMLLQWREGLAGIESDYIAAVGDKFAAETGYAMNDMGGKKVRQWLKRFTLAELLEALDASLGTYFKSGDEDPDRNFAMACKAFDMVPRVANAKNLNAEKPWMKDLFYIRAIVRNSMYCNERVALQLIQEVYELGGSIEDMNDWAKQARNWTNWRNEMEVWIEDLRAAEGEPE